MPTIFERIILNKSIYLSERYSYLRDIQCCDCRKTREHSVEYYYELERGREEKQRFKRKIEKQLKEDFIRRRKNEIRDQSSESQGVGGTETSAEEVQGVV